MQRKPPLRIRSLADVVRHETKDHFRRKGVKLPPQWKKLVSLACYPGLANTPLGKDALKAFARFYSHHPDSALEIFGYARKQRLRHWTPKEAWTGCSNTEHARRFLLWNELLLETRNMQGQKELNLLLKSIVDSGEHYKIVPVASLQDKEVAAFVFGPTCSDKEVGAVRDARRSLSRRPGARSRR